MEDPEERQARERIGQTVGGHWKLDRVLGVGGMAAVYAASSEYGSEAAIKILHPALSKREDVRERFVQEGELAKHMDHPGIVRVRGIYAEPDQDAYLVMELLHGETLADRMARDDGIEEEELVRVIDEVLDVLVEAHGKGVVHRDLKPDNLFLTEDGHLKVLDFGIARLSGANQKHKTKQGIALGTVPYMAPEQALGKRGEIDARTDLFALGAMAFRILAHRNVHLADTEAELLIAMASKPAPPLRTVAPRVTPELASIIDMALAFSQDSRYPDARTMQADVRALMAGGKPRHASKAIEAREMSTRVDLAAPVIPDSVRAAASQPASPPTGPEDDLDWADSVRGPQVGGAASVVEAPTQVSAVAPKEPESSGGRGLWLALLLLVVAGAAATAWALGGSDGANAPLPAPLERAGEAPLPPSEPQAPEQAPGADEAASKPATGTRATGRPSPKEADEPPPSSTTAESETEGSPAATGLPPGAKPATTGSPKSAAFAPRATPEPQPAPAAAAPVTRAAAPPRIELPGGKGHGKGHEKKAGKGKPSE